jgi:peptide deformylase
MHYTPHEIENNILYSPSSPWDFEKEGSPLELLKDMTRVMFEKGGVGLSAPQIGVSRRVFIMGNPDKLIACINPIFYSVDGGELVLGLEGCLSFPNLWLHVKRHLNINAQYKDVDGNQVDVPYTGIMARIYQHECEHLDGICFTSKVSKFALDQAKRKQKKASRK